MVACDLCHAAGAVVYCYNDSAHLCKACDVQIHKTNRLAWRHHRTHLCETCDGSSAKPAAVYCEQDKVRPPRRHAPIPPRRTESRARRGGGVRARLASARRDPDAVATVGKCLADVPSRRHRST